MPKPQPHKYRTTNWRDYNRSLKQRGSLLLWIDKEMEWLAPGSGKQGRADKFSDAAIQFCLMIKNLFGLALRQASGMVASLLKLSGLDWSTPDYSTLCRRQQRLQVCISYRPNPKGLHLLVDSTGVKMLGEGEWKTKKHGAEYRRQWRKVHLGVDAETLEIRAIEVTSNREGDAQILPALLNQIPADERIESVSGDGAYNTKKAHAAISERNAEAIIPVRKNGKPWKENTAGAKARNEILRAIQQLGRAIWKTWSGYHRRSLVETKMRCFKLLGERVNARLFNSQVAELQIRVALLNRFTQLGTPMTVAMP
ncbi:IS5 family transposase [Methylomonas fluvii]|uniref:IS5 family transposase n=1 Tax=Methylomonas fluvii TaxID=1854564 RepID=A0ABR9DF90_9GAMM|nr:IS5 family transposase [Methylomonas fluvii]MBD9361742.1 IS5 family transposase [Methylomonas fluvii]